MMSESLTWSALQNAWEAIKMNPTKEKVSQRWHYVKARVDLDDWMKKDSVLLAVETSTNVLVMKQEGTHCRVLSPVIANIVLAPIDPNKEYTFVDESEDEAFAMQWYALRQLTRLVAHENAEEASKHLGI